MFGVIVILCMVLMWNPVVFVIGCTYQKAHKMNEASLDGLCKDDV